MTDAITHAILRAVNDPGSLTQRRSESGQLETLGTWQVRAILGHAAPLIRDEAAQNALCWQQPEDGRMLACDRAKAHKGRHSWDSGPASEHKAAALREFASEMEDLGMTEVAMLAREKADAPEAPL